MVLFNYSTRELTAKIVYYGPGLCGKTTNLQYIHSALPDNVKGKMLSLATKTDRTLFFDFLPIDLGEIRGLKTRVQLYTVPGQVFYNETRKLVLKGADGIVFVADSQATMLGANVESFKNLEENLRAHGLKLAEMPHVIQFNKRDLPRLSPVEELNAAINRYNAPFYESVATTGIGVQDSLKAITKLVLLHLTRKYDPKAAPVAEPRPVAAPAPAAAPPPAAVPIAAVARQPHDEGAIPISRSPAPVFAAERAIDEPAFEDVEIEELVDEVRESDEVAEPMEAVEPPADAPYGDDSEEGFELSASEDLVIDEAPPSAEPHDGSAFASSSPAFEIDHGVDPDWGAGRSDTPEAELDPVDHVAPSWEVDAPVPAHAAAPALDEQRVLEPELEPDGESSAILSDPATDADLFEDPTLDVARMEPGTEREIVVPVEVADARGETRRLKLTLRLRLDPVD